jgi:hypothetical protein
MYLTNPGVFLEKPTAAQLIKQSPPPKYYYYYYYYAMSLITKESHKKGGMEHAPVPFEDNEMLRF